MESYREDCPFCQMAGAGMPAHGLYEDQSCMVLLDRESLGFGHSLVIPKRHVEKIYRLEEPEYTALVNLARKFASQLERALEVKAVGYVAFGTGLEHAHLHLVPLNEERVLLYPNEYLKTLTDEELRVTAEKLRPLLR